MDRLDTTVSRFLIAANVFVLFVQTVGGEHILRLLDPVADHKHVKVHRRDD